MRIIHAFKGAEFMIEPIVRWVAGKYLNRVIDFYVMYQSIFNVAIVTFGFLWLLYCKNKKWFYKMLNKNSIKMSTKRK